MLLAALSVAPCDCVGFRFDDIQDYYDRDGQIAVIKLFREYNATLTVGVIGGSIGHDKELVAFLQENGDIIEFANHGWLHEDFSSLSTDEQSRLMNQTSVRIKELFGAKPVTFIAPFNRLNSGTVDALNQNGMIILTADKERDYPALDERQIFHLPANANVSDYDEEKLFWKSFDNEVVLADVRKGLESDGYAMIMMHPRDFVDGEHKADQAKLEELKKLITRLRSEGVRIVTVQEMAGLQKTPEFDAAVVVAGLSFLIAFYALIKHRRGQEQGKPTT